MEPFSKLRKELIKRLEDCDVETLIKVARIANVTLTRIDDMILLKFIEAAEQQRNKIITEFIERNKP